MAGRLRSPGTVALASAGAVGLGLWRRLMRAPLPRTRGTVAVDGLEGHVTIGRDRFGVPRVEARSERDVWLGQGFCLAQDRLWQLELYRRAASGRLAELVGEDALELDVLMRTLGLRRRAEAEVATLAPAARAALEAVAAGIDAAVAAAPAPPFELQLLRTRPEPWTPADSLAIGKLIAFGFSTNMENELLRADLLASIGAERTARLEPRYLPGRPVITEPGVPWSGDGLGLASQLAEARAALGFGLEPAGSNNWVVSGARSVTGMPLLVADAHVTTTMPAIFYMVELSTPDFELRGCCLPALPGLIMGHNRHVAWSFTNAMADVQDLFVERVRSAHEGHQPAYAFRGDWLPIGVLHERIDVRGRAPERIQVWETHHGPIVNRPLRADAGEPLALAWTALREPWPVALGRSIAYTTTGDELVEAFGQLTIPCMNMVWADTRGRIGYKLVGRFPNRRGGSPDVPRPGWTGEHEWDGYVPYAELPELRDPPGGTIASANNRMAPPDYPHHLTSEYQDGYRAERIEQLLAERERHSIEDFERMLTDVLSLPGLETARRLAELRPEGQREVRAIERLRSWDGRMDADSVAASICHVFTAELGRAVAEAAIGDEESARRWRSKSRLGFSPLVTTPWRFHSRLLELWEEADPELVGGRSWDDVALESLSAALDELERRLGDDSAGWRWGALHGIRFTHTLGEADNKLSRLLARLLSRELPAGGAPETLWASHHIPHAGDYRAIASSTCRMITDLGDLDGSRWQLAIGQSGHPGSAHYDDLAADWLAGRTNPVAQPATRTLRLEPA